MCVFAVSCTIILMEIVPAILVKDARELQRQIERLSPYFSHFQIDIADGIYVSEKTLKLADAFSTSQPFSDSAFSLDFDLLVEEVKPVLDEISKLAKKPYVKTIFVHNLQSAIELFNHPTTYPFSLGFALDPEISVDTIVSKFPLKDLPAIEIMTVVPGAQGREFIPETLQKIEQLRNAGYRNKIYLDGGITDKTLPVIFSQKFCPDVLCIGSFFSKAEDIKEKVKILNNLLNQSYTPAV